MGNPIGSPHSWMAFLMGSPIEMDDHYPATPMTLETSMKHDETLGEGWDHPIPSHCQSMKVS